MSILTALAVWCTLSLGGTTMAATTPDLATAATFGVLATTFNHDIATTTIYGDLGYVWEAGIWPVVVVGGSTFISGIDPEYLQAETAQNNALIDLNNLGINPCTFTFAAGPIDLAADTTHDPSLAPGVYEPWVYCTAGAATTAAVTLSGAGTYIFRIAGALDMVATTNVTLTNGADACNVFWTPTSATTIGANANFIGTVIGSPGITVGKVIIETSILRKISDTDSFPSFNRSVTQINFFHKQFEQGRFSSSILGN